MIIMYVEDREQKKADMTKREFGGERALVDF
jgi:hypothetical protein